MRTRVTVTLDDDTSEAVERIRREQGIGRSAAINALIRRGLTEPRPSHVYRHRSSRLGLTVDVMNVAEVTDLLEG